MYPLTVSSRFNLLCIYDDNDESIEVHNSTMLECDVFNASLYDTNRDCDSKQVNNCIDVLVLDGPVLIIDPIDDTGTNNTMMHSIISKRHVLSVTSDSEAKLNDDDDEVNIIVPNTTAPEKIPSLNYNCVFNAVIICI